MSKTDNYHASPKMRDKIVKLHEKEGLKADALSLRFGISISGINYILSRSRKEGK